MSNRQQAVLSVLFSDKHLNIHERVNLVLSGKIKPRHNFNLTKSYKVFLNKYSPNQMFNDWSKNYRDEIEGMVADLDDIVNQSLAKMVNYKVLEHNQEPISPESPWIEYILNEKGNYPNEYGTYLTLKPTGAMQFRTWGPNKWGVEDNLVTHYRKINKPIKG